MFHSFRILFSKSTCELIVAQIALSNFVSSFDLHISYSIIYQISNNIKFKSYNLYTLLYLVS